MADMVKFWRPALAAVLLAVGLASAGCSSGGSGGGSGGDSFEVALSRVSDTAATNSQIFYDNTAELVSLAGKGIASQSNGYGQLRGLGASSLGSFLVPLPGDTGINLLNESYAISAGTPPTTLTLIAGGQDSSLVTSRMTKLGWKQAAGGVLDGPSVTAASPSQEQYAAFMQRVQAENSDVLIGGQNANLGQLGSPSGKTLGNDSGIETLAGCLGNVVAAVMSTGGDAGITSAPMEVAVGISQPASASATPQMVACVSWQTQLRASGYEANLNKALATGMSPATEQPYSTLLRDPKVTSVGGPMNIVKWQADPSSVSLLLEMVESENLPALPNCGHMTQAQAQQVTGCH